MSKAYHSRVCRATSTARMAVTASQEALGTTGSFPSTEATPGIVAGAQRWHNQSLVRALCPDEAVSTCMRRLQEGASNVGIVHVAATQSAHFTGLQTCGSVWICPVCASKITENRKQEIETAIRYARAHGLRVVMVTYTFRHNRADSLEEMVEAMSKAFESYRSGRPYRRLTEGFGVAGYIRALEVTYSETNGWHPHVHELIFMAADADIVMFADKARRQWERAAARQGLSMNEHGFRLDDCDDKIADYIAKFGREPSETTRQAWESGWNEASELSKWHIKRGGRGLTLAQDEHVTPFGLLRYYDEGDAETQARAGWLFREYARVFKGRHQLQWSRGLKELFGIDEKSDKQLVEEEQENGGEELASLTRPAWAVVLGNDARYELLQVARLGDIEQLAAFLRELGIARTSYSGFSVEMPGQQAS